MIAIRQSRSVAGGFISYGFLGEPSMVEAYRGLLDVCHPALAGRHLGCSCDLSAASSNDVGGHAPQQRTP